MKKIKSLFDATLWKFIIVGILNTIFGTAIMFISYNFFHFSYWASSAANYIFGSILSYFLNKYFTFKNTEKSAKQVFIFIINISLCYFAAYGLAKKLAILLLPNLEIKLQENISMLIGMGVFIVLNYLGQRLVVFKKTDS